MITKKKTILEKKIFSLEKRSIQSYKKKKKTIQIEPQILHVLWSVMQSALSLSIFLRFFLFAI